MNNHKEKKVALKNWKIAILKWKHFWWGQSWNGPKENEHRILLRLAFADDIFEKSRLLLEKLISMEWKAEWSVPMYRVPLPRFSRPTHDAFQTVPIGGRSQYWTSAYNTIKSFPVVMYADDTAYVFRSRRALEEGLPVIFRIASGLGIQLHCSSTPDGKSKSQFVGDLSY